VSASFNTPGGSAADLGRDRSPTAPKQIDRGRIDAPIAIPHPNPSILLAIPASDHPIPAPAPSPGAGAASLPVRPGRRAPVRARGALTPRVTVHGNCPVDTSRFPLSR
jgi:hypothetical protein